MKAEGFDDLTPQQKYERVSLRALQLELHEYNEIGLAERNATPAILDFSQVSNVTLDKPSGNWQDPAAHGLSPDGYTLNPAQIRRRNARAARRYKQRMSKLSVQELEVMHRKPLEDWDAEELARGRPRSADGTFKGPKPTYITPEVHEEAMDRFKSIVKTGMRAATVDAIEVIKDILNDESTDNRGKPMVGAGTKLQAAQFLIEHVVGKPTQRVEQDVSVKLQAILAGVMVNPGEQATGNFMPAHLPGLTMELASMAGMDDGDPSDFVPE